MPVRILASLMLLFMAWLTSGIAAAQLYIAPQLPLIFAIPWYVFFGLSGIMTGLLVCGAVAALFHTPS